MTPLEQAQADHAALCAEHRKILARPVGSWTKDDHRRLQALETGTDALGVVMAYLAPAHGESPAEAASSVFAEFVCARLAHGGSL